MSSRLTRGGALAVALVLSLAIPAAASAFGPTKLTAAPSNTQAGANSDFTIDFALTDAARDLRSFAVHLPPGELANLAGTPECTQAQFTAKTCPDQAKVGVVSIMRDGRNTDPIPGTLYRVVPPGSSPGRLGLRLTPRTGDETLLQAPITVRDADHGFDFGFDDIPRTTGTDITQMSLVLFGTAAASGGGYMSNPSSCAPATTAVDTTAYDNSAGSASASFTATGCELLPFAPTVTAVAAGTAINQHPQLMTIVNQGAGQAPPASMALNLPLGIGPVQAANRACSTSRIEARRCPLRSQVGSVQAQTPIVDRALQGPVLLAASSISPLPLLVLDLRGPIALRLQAPIGFGALGRMVTTVGPMPDLPLSRLTFTLNAGTNGLLFNHRDLCDPPAPTVDVAFTATTGATSVGSAPVATPGCATVVPRVSAQLKGVRRHKPSLTLVVRASTGPRLTSVAVSLPRTLQVLRRRARTRVAAVSGGLRVPRTAMRTRTRSLTVRPLPGIGSRSIRIGVHHGALRSARSLRPGARVKLVVKTVDATGRRRTRSVKVRAKG